MKIMKSLLLTMVLLLATACGKKTFDSDGTQNTANSAEQDNSSYSDNNGIIIGQNQSNCEPDCSVSEIGQKPMAIVVTNSVAQNDCSLSSASFQMEFHNVDKDMLVCNEFILDLPKTSRRYGESYACDQDSKFVTLINKTSWVYDAEKRTYIFNRNDALDFIRKVVVPGMYRSVFKDKNGVVYYSSWGVFKRAGGENCSPNNNQVSPPPPTGTLSYEWIAITAGPVPQPTEGCNAFSVNRRVVHNGYTWTCSKVYK